MRSASGSRRGAAFFWLAGLSALLLLTGCAAGGSVLQQTGPLMHEPAAVSPAVRPAAAPGSAAASASSGSASAVTAALTTIRTFLTGDVFAGSSPDGRADYTGVLHVDEQLAGRRFSEADDIRAAGVGEQLSLTVRRSSSDAAGGVDILHRPGNPDHDYLLLGSGFAAVAPTSWVTVPARFGDGLGCTMPAYVTACQLVDDLLANQRLSPPLPTDTVTASAGATTITAAVTVRQALALNAWTFRAATAPLLAKAASADLDRTLVTVTITAADSRAPVAGALKSFRVSGTFTVAGTPATLVVSWQQGRDAGLLAQAEKTPIPSRALYTPLNAAQMGKLTAQARKQF